MADNHNGSYSDAYYDNDSTISGLNSVDARNQTIPLVENYEPVIHLGEQQQSKIYNNCYPLHPLYPQINRICQQTLSSNVNYVSGGGCCSESGGGGGGGEEPRVSYDVATTTNYPAAQVIPQYRETWSFHWYFPHYHYHYHHLVGRDSPQFPNSGNSFDNSSINGYMPPVAVGGDNRHFIS